MRATAALAALGLLDRTAWANDHDTHHNGPPEDMCPEAMAKHRLSLTNKQFAMGCDPIVVWQLAQLTMPGAKHFLEAGANLGFYAARFFNLWSPGTGLMPSTLQERLAEEWHGSATYGTCHDGTPNSNPVSFLCRSSKDDGFADPAADNPYCKEVRPAVQYHAFDGSLSFVNNVSALVHKHWPQANFNYNPGAVMHRPGGEMMFAQRNDEGGHVLPHQSNKAQPGKQGKKPPHRRAARSRRLTSFPMAAVPVITVDSYAEQHGLSLDGLKVDVEGYDLAVLAGALKQLETSIWFVQFEWGSQFFRYDDEQPTGPGGHNWTTYGGGVEALDALGFTCYFTGDRYGTGRLLVQISGCMKHAPYCQALGNDCPHIPDAKRRAGGIQATKIKKGKDGWGRFGDVVCAHRRRAPAFAWALHAAEKRGLSMAGPTRKKLHTDPVVLGEILADLRERNGGTLEFPRNHHHGRRAHHHHHRPLRDPDAAAAKAGKDGSFH